MFKKSKVEFNNRELFEQPYEIDRAKLELAVKRATNKLKARVQRDGTSRGERRDWCKCPDYQVCEQK